MQSNQPSAKIVITGPSHGLRPAWHCLKLILAKAPAPVVFVSREEDIPDHIAGIIVTGGSDIGPEYYGGLPLSTGRYDAMRDQLEAKLINFALEQSVPLFCICRGMQLMNIVCGGSLHSRAEVKDIRGWKPQSVLPVKRASVATETKLFSTYKQNCIWVNSLHWQALSHLGNDLVVTGRDQQGLVQAIEHQQHPFAVGTQWHPEYLFYLRKHRALIHSFSHAVTAFLSQNHNGAKCTALPRWTSLHQQLGDITPA